MKNSSNYIGNYSEPCSHVQMESLTCPFEENFDGIWVVEGTGHSCRSEVRDEKLGVFGCPFYGSLESCVATSFAQKLHGNKYSSNF